MSDACYERRELKIKMEEKGRLLKSHIGAILYIHTYMYTYAYRWKEVSDACYEKRELKIKMEEKGRLLKSHIGAILDTASLSKSWDELELRLSAHEKNVEEQKDKLRALIEKRIKDFKIEIEKFAARWRGSKPDASGLKDRESAAAILEEVC